VKVNWCDGVKTLRT